jgi:hypothetical protein
MRMKQTKILLFVATLHLVLFAPSSSSSSHDKILTIDAEILQATRKVHSIPTHSHSKTKKLTPPDAQQNLAIRTIGDKGSETYKCTMITIVLDTPIYVRSKYGKNTTLVPYGPPSHSRRGSIDVYFVVSLASKPFDFQSLTTVLNAYNSTHTTSWKRKAFSMFSHAYESSHHIIEILVPSRISSSSLVTFDLPSSVSLFDRSGNRLHISNLPADVILPPDEKHVHFAAMFDVVSQKVTIPEPCGRVEEEQQDEDGDAELLNQLEISHKALISPFGMIFEGIIGVVLEPVVKQISGMLSPQLADVLGPKILEQSAADVPLKTAMYVPAAVTYVLYYYYYYYYYYYTTLTSSSSSSSSSSSHNKKLPNTPTDIV